MPWQTQSFHHRHAEITEDEVRTATSDEPREPFVTARRDGDVGAELRQQDSGEFTVIAIILNNNGL